MTGQPSRRWLVACLLLFVCAIQVPAAERSYWRHSKGHFENTTENKWTEKCPTGPFHFVETKRTEKFVELHDKSRDVTVRLFDERCTVKSKEGKFEKYYEGKWVERTAWQHSKGHFENTTDNKWTEKCPTGPFHFVETKRTREFVELHDKSRDVTVRLFDAQCELKSKEGKFEKLYEGKWDGK